MATSGSPNTVAESSKLVEQLSECEHLANLLKIKHVLYSQA